MPADRRWRGSRQDALLLACALDILGPPRCVALVKPSRWRSLARMQFLVLLRETEDSQEAQVPAIMMALAAWTGVGVQGTPEALVRGLRRKHCFEPRRRQYQLGADARNGSWALETLSSSSSKDSKRMQLLGFRNQQSRVSKTERDSWHPPQPWRSKERPRVLACGR